MRKLPLWRNFGIAGAWNRAGVVCVLGGDVFSAHSSGGNMGGRGEGERRDGKSVYRLGVAHGGLGLFQRGRGVVGFPSVSIRTKKIVWNGAGAGGVQ